MNMPDKMVNEKDKPFILALILVGALLGVIFGGMMAVNYGNVMMEEYVDKILAFLGGMVTTIIGFYFGKKNSS